jgi:heme-degrading monooxygenase HmoA
MVARVTLAEVDTVRVSLDDAIELYEHSVLPALQEQEGFEGAYVLATPEGKAMVLTFWEDDSAAGAGVESGFYAEQVEKFVTLYRTPPGRELYDVVVADAPVVTMRRGRS